MSIICSLRFSTTDITIIKLDQKTQKILSLFQQALPAGLISRGLIADSSKLLTVVKAAFNQAHCLGQEVVIGFPDDRTLISSTDVSHIPTDKLAEALPWQVEDTFPDAANLYVDWQIINQRALLAAAPKQVIDGFVAVVIQAGAKPVACEPTSITLAKLVPSGSANIVLEIRPAASIIVLEDASKLVSFSTQVTNPGEIVLELNRLITFYQQKHSIIPAAIYLGGEGATQDWLQFINSAVKIPTLTLPLPKVANLPENPLRFVVPLALTQGPILPSKDKGSINLLPPNLELEYAHQTEKKQLSFGFKASLMATVVTFAIMLTAFISIRLTTANVQAQIAQLEQTESLVNYNDMAKQAEQANALARQLDRLPAKDNLVQVISELDQSLPKEVVMRQYTINLPEKVVLVDGLTPTRDSLLKFKSNLESSSIFSLVTIPLPTLEQKQNVEFSIAIDMKSSK